MAGQEAIWHVLIGGKEQGPLTKAQVLEYLRHSSLAGSDLIWRPGFPDWKSVSEIGDFWQPPKRTPVQSTSVQSAPDHVPKPDKIVAPSAGEKWSLWKSANIGLLVSAFVLLVQVGTGQGFELANYAHTASAETVTKREVVPGLRRLAVMANVGFPQGVLEMGEVQAVARKLGIEVASLEIRRAEDIAPAFEALNAQADALYVVGDALVSANRTRIMTFSLSARLPTTFNTRVFVQAGGLMSYGPSFSDQFRRTAELVDKILRGTKPGDIPVEQPTRFELVINLTTAKALGLTIPESFLMRADEVIE